MTDNLNNTSSNDTTSGTVEAALKNLRALDFELVRLGERREAHLAELARLLLCDPALRTAYRPEYTRDGVILPPDDDILRERYLSLMTGSDALSGILPEDVLDENRIASARRLSVMTALERAGFCRSVAQRYSKEFGELGSDMTELFCAMLYDRDSRRAGDDYEDDYDRDDPGASEGNKKTENRISYLRNYFADTAYTIFSRVLDEPTVTYNTDFAGVCEDVYYGRAGCCILPIESTADGRLASFRSLIRKYELKTVFTCSVETGDGVYTKFALLKKYMTRLKCPEKLKGDSFFEFDVTLDGISALSGVLEAAQLNDLGLARVDSLPSSYARSGYSYEMTFRTDGGFLDGFLCYLFMEDPGFTPIGIYTEIVDN